MTVLDQIGRVELLGGSAGWGRTGSVRRPATPVELMTGAAHRAPLRTVLVSADAVAVVAAWAIVQAVVGTGAGLLPRAAGAAAAVITAVAALAMAGLYRSRVSSIRAVELARLPRVAVVATAAGTVVSSRLGAGFSLPALVGLGVASAAMLVLARNTFDAYLRQCRARGRYCRSLLLVGDGPEADELRTLLARHPELGFRVVAVADPDDDLVALADRVGANGVLFTAVAMSDGDQTAVINRLLAAKIHVHLSAGLRGFDPRRLRVVPIGHEPLFYVEPSGFQPWQAHLKRVFDVAGAAVLLVLSAPLLAAAAIAVKRTDGGPVLFRQERVGRDGRLFTCLKLRTMRVGAELEQAQVENLRTGPLFKAAHDPRVTRVGRFLRQSSIDELPQLINVLRGEMSLVGPRPALASEVAQFDPELLRRLDVTPGLTGIWQVEARDVPDFDAYRRLDLYYVENWRLSLDIVVLVLTAQEVVARLVGCVLGRFRRDAAVIDLTAPLTLD